MPFITTVFNWLTGWRAKKEAREAVVAEITKAEAEATIEAVNVIAEDRSPSDAVKRLDDGSF
jgi:hypothetical protein